MLRDAQRFAELASPWMATDPYSTNVIGVHLATTCAGKQPVRGDSIWVAVLEGGEVVGVAMHTPPHNLFLPRLKSGLPSQIALALARNGRTLSGVTGEVASVEEFAGTWETQTGIASHLSHAMRMYRLDAVSRPRNVQGQPRPAGRGDRALLMQWFTQFHAEAVPDSPTDDVAELVERRLAHYETWLWCVEDTPVSLAGCSRPASRLARVGPVYTPSEHRRRGYGAAVTAHATQSALDGGATQVVLYTDLANSTSNAIYQSIGYIPDHDAEERSFVQGM